MLKKKPLVVAIAAAGLCMTAGSVTAVADQLQDVCGMTLTGDNGINCNFGLEIFTEDCKIDLDPGANLTINACNVDADGYLLDIDGDDDATLTFNGNATIANASKIDFDFDGRSSDNCVPDVITVVDYDFESNGAGKRQSRIIMNVHCGSIYVDFVNFNDFNADRMIWLKTADGDINIYGGTDNALLSSEDGAIKIFAGAEGKATIGNEVALSAGEISIVSQGGTSEVGSP